MSIDSNDRLLINSNSGATTGGTGGTGGRVPPPQFFWHQVWSPPSPKSVQSDRVSDKITPYSSSEYAEAERSFSSLRRLKTYLRCCVGQERLSHINHIAVLNVGLHQDELDAVNLCKVGQEFVDMYPSRQHVFGRFTPHS